MYYNPRIFFLAMKAMNADKIEKLQTRDEKYN